jgi:glycerol uptake facilitator-like aquaporin
VLALGLLIWTLGPISGAHFNPAVSGVALVRGEIAPREAAAYVPAQVCGAITGAVLANLMFALPAVEFSTTQRTGVNLLLGEVVATAGLLWIIGALTRTGTGRLGPVLVPAWIGSAYFFTSSTSFANPAVTIGRAFTDTFAGIAPASVLLFIAAQLVGAAIGAAQTELFHPRRGVTPEPLDLPAPIHDRA